MIIIFPLSPIQNFAFSHSLHPFLLCWALLCLHSNANLLRSFSGKAKCKISGLVDNSKKRVPIPLEELIDESFEGSCILKLYQAYVGLMKSISLSVEEILVTNRETSNSYFDDEEY